MPASELMMYVAALASMIQPIGLRGSRRATMKPTMANGAISGNRVRLPKN